jgi:hypothetical protein
VNYFLCDLNNWWGVLHTALEVVFYHAHMYLPIPAPLLKALLQTVYCNLKCHCCNTSPFLLAGTCIHSRGLLFLGKGSNQQELDLESRDTENIVVLFLSKAPVPTNSWFLGKGQGVHNV